MSVRNVRLCRASTIDRALSAGYGLRMIKLTVSYPKGDDVTFDHDYYKNSHVPMCVDAFAPSKVELERGIDGPSVASVSFYFESSDAMKAAMSSPKMGDIMGDVANYTNAAPSMQVSEVVD